MSSNIKFEQIHSNAIWVGRMNLNQIGAFRAVMRTGSMTAAAQDLRTSQPSISRRRSVSSASTSG